MDNFFAGCKPHVNGSNVGLGSKAVEEFLQNNMTTSLKWFDHANYPTKLRLFNNFSFEACKEANDALREYLLDKSKKPVQVKIVVSEESLSGFGMWNRLLHEEITVTIGKLVFGNFNSIELERKFIKR